MAAKARQAGRYTAHEMMEALDANDRAEIDQSLMAERERVLDGTPEYDPVAARN